MSSTGIGAIPKINGFSLQRPRLAPRFAIIGVMLVIALFFVWSRLQVLHLEYEISRFESVLRQTGEEINQLRLEAASLRNPVRIERVARAEIGLRLPSPEQIIVVE